VGDIVAKVAETSLWNSNLKQSNRGVRTFESMLRVRCENSRLVATAENLKAADLTCIG